MAGYNLAPMGFPQWTLWGMGLSILTALLALGYSLYLQSPARQVAYHAEPYRRESRIRAATTVAFALLLVTFGFYAAGVPIGEQPIVVNNNAPSQPINDGVAQAINIADDVAAGGSNAAADAQAQAPSSGSFGAALPQDDAQDESDGRGAAASAGSGQAETAPQSGAGGGTVSETPTTEATAMPTIEPTETPIPTPTVTPTDAPTATPMPTPTRTPTPLPTNTPTPTLTPTPITEATAQVATGGSTLWVKRSPGGQNLVILRDGETVILLPGNANQAGLLWKEVKTVQGVSGWVQAQFLSFGEDESDE